MSAISQLRAREILDSRATPTLEVAITLEDGTEARASVPSGASTGKHEAFELRDGDPRRYGGKGVLKSVALVEGEIASLLSGMEACEQAQLDANLCALDRALLEESQKDNQEDNNPEDNKASSPKSLLGAQACLAVSLACARAASVSLGIPLYRHLGGVQARTLPVPMMNIINGGAHANNALEVQEFMLLPSGASDFSEALRMGVECYAALKSLLEAQGESNSLGDEGGFAPAFKSTQQALDLLMQAIEKAGLKSGEEITLALDCAASSYFQKDAKKDAKNDDSKQGYSKQGYFWDGTLHDSQSYAALLKTLVESYPIVSLEDPFAEDDWHGWSLLTKMLGEKIQLVGDDLFVSQEERLLKGFALSAGNALLLKPNQVGTLSEAMACGRLALERGWGCVVSHRSGDTEDSFIADLAVGLGCGQIKTGAPARSERVAKYNRLLRIHEELGDEARYRNPFARNPFAQPFRSGMEGS